MVYATGVASMGEDFNSLNFFIVEQQKSGTFTLLKGFRFAPMLFNYFNIYTLKCLRVL